MAVFLKIMSFAVWVFMMVLVIRGSRRKKAPRSLRQVKASRAADADINRALFITGAIDNPRRWLFPSFS